MKPTPIYIFDRNETLRLILEPKTHTSIVPGKSGYTQCASMFIGDGETSPMRIERPLPYTNGKYIEELNGQETLEFEVPYTESDEEVEWIEGDGRVVLRHPTEWHYVEFVIRTPIDSNGHQGTVKEVFCEDSEYELNDAWITGYAPSEPVNLRTALTAVLQGTRFEPGEVMETDERLLRLGPMSVKRAITELIALYGGEKRKRVEFRGNRITRRFIDILSRRGQFTGKRWEFGKDFIYIRREVDYTGIKTALYGFGQSQENDGPRIDFANVVWSKVNGDPVDKPAGQRWVGDPEALARYGYDGGTRHRFGVHDSQAEDPGQLLLETWQELQRRNKPNSTYEMDVILLERLTGRDHEKVRLGDGTYVIDRMMKPAAELEAHVIRFEHDLNEPEKSRVLLGNFRESFFAESERIRSVERIVNDRQGNWDHKETPAGAQQKANQAEVNAKSYAEQRVQEAEQEIEAAKQRLDEAENRITQAEQDIAQVDQRLTDEASRLEQHAIDVSNDAYNQAVADAAQYTEQYAVGEGVLYNGVSITNTDGFLAVRSDGLVRTIMNATNGFVIQSRSDVSDLWSSVFWADSEGNLRLAGKIVTQEGGVFDGDIIARNLTLTNNITAQNAVITGTIIGSGATFQRVDIENAVIINADIVDAVITGELVGAYIDGGNIYGAYINGGEIYGSTITASSFISESDSDETGWDGVTIDSGSIRIDKIGPDTVVRGTTIIKPTGISYQASFQYPDFIIDATSVRFEGNVLVNQTTSFFDDVIVKNAAPMYWEYPDSDRRAEISASENPGREILRLRAVEGGTDGGANLLLYSDNDSSSTFRGTARIFASGTERLRAHQSGVTVYGDHNATGSKSAIVDTENYGQRKLYALEAPDVRFMDVIEQTLTPGEHWIELNQMFAETINGYSVFPIAQDGGRVRVLERTEKRFKVKVSGDSPVPVACWIYGKRKGYEDVYMEEVTDTTEGEENNESIEH